MSLKNNAFITVDELLTSMDKSRADIVAPFLSIYNSSGDASAATISMSGSTLTLVVTGGANAGTSTFSLVHVDYDTLAELVAAINALNKGWVANRLGASANLSADLQNIGAISCLGTGNIQAIYGYASALLEQIINSATDFIEKYTRRTILQKALTEYYDVEPCQKTINLQSYPLKDADSILVYAWDYLLLVIIYTYAIGRDYAVDLERGSIFANMGWPVGKQAVKVVYTAGWQSADIPWDLKNACFEICKLIFNRRDKQGIESERAGNYQALYDKGERAESSLSGDVSDDVSMPGYVLAMLKPYRRTLV